MLSNFCHGLCGNGGVNSPAGKVFSELSIDLVNVTSEAESDLFKVGMYSLPYLLSSFTPLMVKSVAQFLCVSFKVGMCSLPYLLSPSPLPLFSMMVMSVAQFLCVSLALTY